jgi:3-isopropylmalate/(R)-2-methylmalate dehydratase small subunit
MKGKAWKFGDNINTDEIIPARYLNTSDPAELARHCMEDADPEFPQKISAGDIIVGGENFGCGSSREHAPIAIKAAGLSCVIAKSFARIFFRNAYNMGLMILESTEASDKISTGDSVEVDLNRGKIINHTKDQTYTIRPIPQFMQELVSAGGLLDYIKKKLD